MQSSYKAPNMAPTTFRFGDKVIPSQQVFIARRHVYAMVNVSPLVPGHVTVVPTRVVQHFKDLTELETLELFMCSKEIAKKFQDTFNVRSFSFILQDGDNAGSQVKHVHMHIMPRDDGQKSVISFADQHRIERNLMEMAEEANTYKNLFEKRHHLEPQYNSSRHS